VVGVTEGWSGKGKHIKIISVLHFQMIIHASYRIVIQTLPKKINRVKLYDAKLLIIIVASLVFASTLYIVKSRHKNYN